MKNIVKDIEENCPECQCDPEATVNFLKKRGDFHFKSDHYREIWFFYKEAIKEFGKRQGRRITLEVMNVTPRKFKYIRAWARDVGLIK